MKTERAANVILPNWSKFKGTPVNTLAAFFDVKYREPHKARGSAVQLSVTSEEHFKYGDVIGFIASKVLSFVEQFKDFLSSPLFVKSNQLPTLWI